MPLHAAKSDQYNYHVINCWICGEKTLFKFIILSPVWAYIHQSLYSSSCVCVTVMKPTEGWREGGEQLWTQQGKKIFLFSSLDWGLKWVPVCFGEVGEGSWEDHHVWNGLCLFYNLEQTFWVEFLLLFIFSLLSFCFILRRSIKTGKADTLWTRWQNPSYLPQMKNEMPLSRRVFLRVCLCMQV